MANMKIHIQGLYSGCNPLKPKFPTIKKKLQGNDYLKLFGALYIIAEHNANIIEEYGLSLEQVMSDSAIQDDELYFNGFEGYDLNERYNLKTLYLDIYDKVIMSVYDSKYDRFIDFIA